MFQVIHPPQKINSCMHSMPMFLFAITQRGKRTNTEWKCQTKHKLSVSLTWVHRESFPEIRSLCQRRSPIHYKPLLSGPILLESKTADYVAQP